MTRSKKIKQQGYTRFNVENSLNTRGKNHERQPASTSLWSESGYKRQQHDLREVKPICSGFYTGLHYVSSEVDLYLVHMNLDHHSTFFPSSHARGRLKVSSS
jgi:hypothetical protein